MAAFKPRIQAGFGLLELLIALAIIGILAAVALPAYNSHVERSKRSAAVVLMQYIAASMEECALEYGAYNNSNCNTPEKVVEGRKDDTDYWNSANYPTLDDYSFEFPTLTSTSFTLRATPQNSMAGDGKILLEKGLWKWDENNDGNYVITDF